MVMTATGRFGTRNLLCSTVACSLFAVYLADRFTTPGYTPLISIKRPISLRSSEHTDIVNTGISRSYRGKKISMPVATVNVVLRAGGVSTTSTSPLLVSSGNKPSI